MKKTFTYVLSAFIISLIVASCGGGPEYTPIEKLDTFTDEVTQSEIQLPSNWHNVVQNGIYTRSFSTKTGMPRFGRYDSEGVPAAQVSLSFVEMDSTITMETVLEKQFMFEKDYYEGPVDVTIDGVKAKKYTYAFELEDGAFNGEFYIASKDNKLANIVTVEAFAGGMQHYRKNFDEIIGAMKLGVFKEPTKPDTVVELVEQDPPSETLKTINGQGFSMQVPDNFSKERGRSSGEEQQYNYMGMRRGDCYIRVDIFDASKSQDLKKIVDENKAKFPGASTPKASKVGGQDGFEFAYKPSGQVTGHIWYAIKDKKLYRLTINWFNGEADMFKDIFFKSAKTFKFK